MNKHSNPITEGGRQSNDPKKNDHTKKDERDNDATRIRPEKEKKPEPENPPGTGGIPERNINESSDKKPYEREPKHKPEPVAEPGRQKGNAINKTGRNSSSPTEENNQSSVKDDEGNAVMKKYGKGL